MGAFYITIIYLEKYFKFRLYISKHGAILHTINSL